MLPKVKLSLRNASTTWGAKPSTLAGACDRAAEEPDAPAFAPPKGVLVFVGWPKGVPSFAGVDGWPNAPVLPEPPNGVPEVAPKVELLVFVAPNGDARAFVAPKVEPPNGVAFAGSVEGPPNALVAGFRSLVRNGLAAGVPVCAPNASSEGVAPNALPRDPNADVAGLAPKALPPAGAVLPKAPPGLVLVEPKAPPVFPEPKALPEEAGAPNALELLVLAPKALVLLLVEPNAPPLVDDPPNGLALPAVDANGLLAGVALDPTPARPKAEVEPVF